MVNLVALQCPQCGAGIDRTGTVCQYCGTTVRLSEDGRSLHVTGLRCTRCQTENEPGDKHCASCGEALTVTCPDLTCRQHNSVWRKFCLKCGQNIFELRFNLLQTSRNEAISALSQHKSEIEELMKALPTSKVRERLVQALIATAGGLVAFLLLASDHPVVALVAAAISAVVVFAYASDEVRNLAASLTMHRADTERLQEQLQNADNELHVLAAAHLPP